MTRTFVTEQWSETPLDQVSVLTAVQKPVKPWEIRCLALFGSALGVDSWLRSDVTVSALGSESFGIIAWLNCVMSKLPLKSHPSRTADMLTTFKSILPNWAGEPFLIGFLRLSKAIGNEKNRIDSIEIRKFTCSNMCISFPLVSKELMKNSTYCPHTVCILHRSHSDWNPSMLQDHRRLVSQTDQYSCAGLICSGAWKCAFNSI